MSGRSGARGATATSVLWLLLAAAAVTWPPARAAAQARTYALDEDPLRLGNRALAAGRLDEARARYFEAIGQEYQVPQAKFGLATLAVREGCLAEAESLYREAIAVRRQRDGAEYAEARAALGLLLLRLAREADAATEIDAALLAKPDLWEALYGRARLLLAAGDADGAKRLLDRGAKRRGAAESEDLYHHGLALWQLARADLRAAETEALTAQAIAPDDPEHTLLAAQIYDRLGAPALAIPALERALAAPGVAPTAPQLHALGGLYRQVGRYNDARDAWLRAAAADSTYAPPLKDLARLLRLAGQKDRAARTLLRYAQLEPRDFDALRELSDLCLEIGQPAAAVAAARQAVAAAPDDPVPRQILARTALRGLDPAARDEAAALFASLPDSLRRDPRDWLALAQHETSRRRWDDARAAARRALALDPQLAAARYQLGLVELLAGRAGEAVAELEQAVAAAPDDATWQLNLGIALFQAQRLPEAVAGFRRAVALDTSRVEARLLLAQALAAADSLDAAEAEYRRVVAAEPTSAKALRGLGYCAIRRGDYAQATRHYRAATEAEPGNADGWAGLGNAHLGRSELDAAATAFRRAGAIEPDNVTLKRGLELLEQARRAGRQEP